ncbi:protocatechuate 3,4-dioxygenase subunit alpha, partial [Escherichia coli]|nr:protocatechuate 3,4-dioxygenase subunit alpha [Escherichia coli]
EEGFHGFGRSGTEEEGRFSFVTLKPGPVPGPGGTTQAPHVMVAVFARGLLKHLITRIYFEDEEEANGQDPVLRSIGDERV